MDPELAMALRVSMEEERARQEAAAKVTADQEAAAAGEGGAATTAPAAGAAEESKGAEGVEAVESDAMQVCERVVVVAYWKICCYCCSPSTTCEDILYEKFRIFLSMISFRCCCFLLLLLLFCSYNDVGCRLVPISSLGLTQDTKHGVLFAVV